MNKRIDELDSLRGLAAATVLFHHFLISLPGIETPAAGKTFVKWISFPPLHILWAGSQAVILFFVLSGFVLSLPFLHGKPSYFGFIIKRVFRIYVPYIVAILMAIAFKLAIPPARVVGFSDWFNGVATAQPTYSSTLSHVAFLGYYRANLDPVTWSLVHEMRISLVFPLIMYFIITQDWVVCMGSGILLWGVSSLLIHIIKPEFSTSVFYTTEYIMMFIMGALIAKHRAYLRSAYQKLSQAGAAILAFLGILAYTYPFMPTFHAINNFAVSIGASIFVIMAFSSPRFSTFLLLKPVPFLGKMSYSLYLFHAIVFINIILLLHSKCSLGVMLFVSLVCAIGTAALAYYLIEVPSIQLGALLSRRCSPESRRLKSPVVIG